MIQLKNKNEISWIRESCCLLSETFKEIEKLLDEGLETRELNSYAHDYIIKRGGKPSFLNYLNYPASICVSINNEVIHGIPGRRKLKNGDIISIDLGIDLKGYFSDAARTYCIGIVSEARKKLTDVTLECLNKAISQTKVGMRVHDISRAVFNYAKKFGYGVVRDYCGHGLGFSQHEDPQIPNYVSAGPNPRLKSGMVIAVEPMINSGTWKVQVQDDGWTVTTLDGRDSAHFEHTIAIFEDHTEVLTSF